VTSWIAILLGLLTLLAIFIVRRRAARDKSTRS
jgi:hypothetical protein